MNFYNKFSQTNITTDSPEFNQDELYSDLGSIASSEITVVKLNDVEYNNSDRKISIGGNSYIVAPVFMVNENNHLLVSNFYLIAHAKDGITLVETEENAFEVALEGLDGGDTLALNKVQPILTRTDRINEVTVDNNIITQVSNNGNQGVAVTLEADGLIINDTDLVIYSLKSNGDMGMTTPEATGADEVYTYGTFLKYTGKDFTAEDAGTYPDERTLIVPGKGNITLIFVLEAQEYVA